MDTPDEKNSQCRYAGTLCVNTVLGPTNGTRVMFRNYCNEY
jgi:hypothetical protein